MQNPDRIAAAVAELAAAIAERSAPQTVDAPERLLNIPEATKVLGVGRTKVYDLIGAGQLNRGYSGDN